MFKRKLALIISICMVICLFAGCKSNDNSTESSDKLKILCTVFPQYDWVREITNGVPNADVSVLNISGTDMHSYQATAEDIIKIAASDVFIYIGGESDGWVHDALNNCSNKDIVAVNLLDTLGNSAKTEEIIDGMQADEHEHSDDDHEHEHDEDDAEYDEHVWLSLKNAQLFVDVISSKLGELDFDNSNTYKENANAYKEKLKKLDNEFTEMVSSSKTKALLFGDRFPFRYLVDDYNITYYAAFIGCSAETEASFETITFLSQKIDELSLKYVITLDNSNQKIAKTIIANTADKNQTVLTLNSMQSVTQADIDNNRTYLSIMQENFNVMSEVLN